jgi:type I restriction enzyme S subunit
MLQTTAQSPADQSVPYLKLGSVSSASISVDQGMFASPSDIAQYQVVEGDLVVAEGGDVGRTAFVPEVPDPTIIQNSLHRLRRERGSDLRYVRYSLEAIRGSGWLAELCNKATFGHLTKEKLTSLPIPNHSPATQRAIADYLDTETARIDSLIEKKRRMVELLHERFTERVDSLVWGVDGAMLRGWQVPVGWASPSLSAAVHITEGQVDPTKPTYCDLPLIAPNHIESGTGRLLFTESASEQGAISGKYICRGGDVIYCKIRPALCKATVAPETCLTSADMYPIRPGEDLLPEFLLYFLLSRRFTEAAVLESDRVAMPKINRDALGRIKVPVPPMRYQRKIVATLNQQSQWTQATTDTLRHQIDLLVEHRQALITAAVTGELNIPGVAA